MMICHGCGGVVGRDCFNPQECEEICRQKAEMSDIVSAENHAMVGLLLRAREIISANRGDNAEQWISDYDAMFGRQGMA